MKIKNMAILIAGLLLSFDGYSQDDVGSGSLTIGGHAALTYGYLTLANSDHFEIQSGYRLGIFTEYRVVDFLAVGTGGNIHYAGTNNARISQLFYDIEPITSTASNIDLKIDKVEIPLYIAVYIGKIKAFSGGSWNLITKVEADILEEVGGLKSNTKMDLTNRFTKDEFSLFVGGGFGFNLGSISLFPEVQYTFGLSNNSAIVGKPSLYHDYLSVGVKIGLNIL